MARPKSKAKLAQLELVNRFFEKPDQLNWTKLYNGLYPNVFKYLKQQFLGQFNNDQLDEITQNCFIKLNENFHKLKENRNAELVTWLIAVGRNECFAALNERKKQYNNKSLDEGFDSTDDNFSQRYVENILFNSNAYETNLFEQQEELNADEKRFNTIDADYNKIKNHVESLMKFRPDIKMFYLCFFKNMRPREIASMEDYKHRYSPNLVSQRIFHAKNEIINTLNLKTLQEGIFS